MKNTENAIIGGRVRTVRKQLGMTIAELGPLLGGAQSFQSKIECGRSQVTVHVVTTLVNQYGVNPYFLLNGTLPVFGGEQIDTKDADLSLAQLKVNELEARNEIKRLERIINLMHDRIDTLEKVIAKHGPC